jgi:hypothetical protein
MGDLQPAGAVVDSTGSTPIFGFCTLGVNELIGGEAQSAVVF